MSDTETTEPPKWKARDRALVEVEIVGLSEDAMEFELATVSLLGRIGGSQLACFDVRSLRRLPADPA